MSRTQNHPLSQMDSEKIKEALIRLETQSFSPVDGVKETVKSFIKLLEHDNSVPIHVLKNLLPLQKQIEFYIALL